MKTKCPLSYHHNSFVATHALGHMIYKYTLLVSMNQRMLNKLSNLYQQFVTAIRFTGASNVLNLHHVLVPAICNCNEAHWYQQCVNLHHVSKCISCHKAVMVITGRAHCFHDCIYISPTLLL